MEISYYHKCWLMLKSRYPNLRKRMDEIEIATGLSGHLTPLIRKGDKLDIGKKDEPPEFGEVV